jgi:hypothetical protein
MSDYETCPACNFQIPKNASACGHCGRNLYRYVEYDKSLFGRLWASIKRGIGFFFLVVILEAIIDYNGIEIPLSKSTLALMPSLAFLFGIISGIVKGNKTKYISYN